MGVIRRLIAHLHRVSYDAGREAGQMEVLESIIDEYGGRMKRIPKRTRRAMIATEEA